MPYTATNWIAGTTPLSQPNLNNIETIYTEATLSLGPDLAVEGFALKGLGVTKTGAAQVTIAAGTGYVKQTDGTLRERLVSSTPETTVTASTTYFADLKPDGTINWATSHSGSNYLTLASVTTDGSGNVLVITDTRPLLLRWLGSYAGLAMEFPPHSVLLGNTLAPPVTTGTVASAIAGAGLGTGAYKYVVSYAFDGGETLQSAAVTVTTTGGNNQVSITGLPVSADPRVTWRKLYRTAVGGSIYTWIATIGDNSTTTYTDAAADAASTQGKRPPSHPFAGGTLRGGYPWSNGLPNPAYVGTFGATPTLGAAGLVTGDPTTCATFAAASSHRMLGSGAGLSNGNASWTLCQLFKFAANPAAITTLGSLGSSTIKTGGKMWIDTSGRLNADVYGTGGITSTAVTTGVPHHAALTWDGTTLTLWLDGVSVGTPTTPGALSLPVAPSVWLGADATIANFWTGQLQYNAVYIYALSKAQLLKQFGLVSGASGSLTYAQQLADDGAQRLYSFGDAVAPPAESSRYDLFMTSDGQLRTAIPVSLDRGLIATDGAGALTVTGAGIFSSTLAVTGAGSFGGTLNATGATTLSSTLGVTGAATLSSTLGVTGVATLSSTLAVTGAMTTLGGQASAGAFGVAVIGAVTHQLSVVNTTEVTVCTLTLPSGGPYLVRLSAKSWVGGANTNNGTVTIRMVATDPVSGGTSFFPRGYSLAGADLGALNAAVVAIGAQAHTMLTLEGNGATAVTIFYKNTAAGTISDKVSGVIEVLG